MIKPWLSRIDRRLHLLALTLVLAIGAHACGGGTQLPPDSRATDALAPHDGSMTGLSSCVLDQSALDDCSL